MHPWDEPAETRLSLGRARGTPLAWPRPGEAVERVLAAPPRAWWRGAAAAPVAATEGTTQTPVEALPHAREIPWPID
jgi:hypothetical protein